MQVNGELRQWHKITLDFEGPSVSETASTFRDYRRDVTFTNAKTGTELLNGGGFGAERMLCMRARTGGPTRPARQVRGDAPAS